MHINKSERERNALSGAINPGKKISIKHLSGILRL